MKYWRSTTWLTREFTVLRYRVQLKMNNHGGVMGRFGGGWKYKIGVAIGSGTTIIDLLYGSIRIDRRPTKKGES